MGRHAYLIMTYDRWEQLGVLINLIDDERNDIFLHINALSKDVPFEIIKNMVNNARLIILERFPIFWGDYSITNCIIQSLKTINRTGQYEYIHLLSGMDLPIKSQNYIHDFFDKNKGANFINTYPFGALPKAWYQRVSLYNSGTKYFRHKNVCIRKIARGIDKVGRKVQLLLGVDRVKKLCSAQNITIMGGATWFSITEQLAVAIIDNENLIKRIFSDRTIFADEMFVQTIVWSFGFGETIFDSSDLYKTGNGSMRYIDWSRGAPYTWAMKDLEELRLSNCLFARKFDQNTDWDIIDSVASMIRNDPRR